MRACSHASSLYLIIREHDKAIAESERAVALDPGGAVAHQSYAWSLLWAGRSEEALTMAQKAIRLNPHGNAYHLLGAACRITGRLEEAVSAYKKSLLRRPDNIIPHIGLIVTYIAMGREKEARIEAGEVIRINPNFTLDYWAKMMMYKDQSVIDRTIGALREAGLKSRRRSMPHYMGLMNPSIEAMRQPAQLL